MSGRWRNAKALQADNVVCLPTAAPRQVKQGCNRWSRAARQALREAQPWPGEYIDPGRREALRRAEQLVDIKHTPALVLAMVIFAELDQDTRLRVIGRIAGSGSPVARDAIAIALAETAPFGEKWDLMWAIDQLRDHGRGSPE